MKNSKVLVILIVCLFIVGCSSNKELNNDSFNENHLVRKDNEVIEKSVTTDKEDNTNNESNMTDNQQEPYPKYIRVLADNLNTRENFNLNSDIVGNVEENDIFQVIEVAVDGEGKVWYQIQNNENFVWIASWFCKGIIKKNPVESNQVPFVEITSEVKMKRDIGADKFMDSFLEMGRYHILETFVSEKGAIWYKVNYTFGRTCWILGTEFEEELVISDSKSLNEYQTELINYCIDEVNIRMSGLEVQYYFSNAPEDIHNIYIPEYLKPRNFSDNEDNVNRLIKIEIDSYKLKDNQNEAEIEFNLVFYSSYGEQLYCMDADFARIRFNVLYSDSEVIIQNIKYQDKYKIKRDFEYIVNDLIVGLDIQLEDQSEQIIKAFNLEDDFFTEDGIIQDVTVEFDGIRLSYWETYGFLGSIALTSPKYITQQGIYVGMTVDELIEIYGEPEHGFIGDEELNFNISLGPISEERSRWSGVIVTIQDGVVTELDYATSGQ